MRRSAARNRAVVPRMMFRCEKLVKRYGRVTALNDLTLAVEPGRGHRVDVVLPLHVGIQHPATQLVGQRPKPVRPDPGQEPSVEPAEEAGVQRRRRFGVRV